LKQGFQTTFWLMRFQWRKTGIRIPAKPCDKA